MQTSWMFMVCRIKILNDVLILPYHKNKCYKFGEITYITTTYNIFAAFKKQLTFPNFQAKC